MSQLLHIDLGSPALLEFCGPDAIRFLNGQMTQDVRLVTDGSKSLPACITDAKGKLQFRVWLHARSGAILIEGADGTAEALEARLTRYLIADDVEVRDLSGQWQLHHLIGLDRDIPDGVIARQSQRYGEAGSDWWVPAGTLIDLPPALSEDDLESFRIERGVPAWGKELTAGMLPPEAGLEASDISYTKGCYIGQEVISRIKSAGKVNRKLERFSIDARIPTDGLVPIDTEGQAVGDLTSISPTSDGATRHALGFIKRGSVLAAWRSRDGSCHPLA